MANNWLTELRKAEAAVDQHGPSAFLTRSEDTFSLSQLYISETPTYYHFGFSTIFWGPPGGGKSLLSKLTVAQLHRDDPTAIALYFNTEGREDNEFNKKIGIDLDRYQAYDTNHPGEIFNYIHDTVDELCKKGAPIKLIVIDSITDVMGRRALDDGDVMTQQRGDEAATVQTGLKLIRRAVRNNKIALILTAHQRAEQDQAELMRHKTVRMAGAYYLRHFSEYFIHITPNEAADGRFDELKNPLKVTGLTDVYGNEDNSAHKISAKMTKSSVGLSGRVGEFTLDYSKGIINVHEEVFNLGVARQVFEQPNNRTYILHNYPENGEQCKWTSKEDTLIGLKQNTDIQKEVLRRIREKDIESHKMGLDSSKADAPELED